MIETLLLIQVIVVVITDLSGFPEDGIKPLFRRWFGIGEPSKIFTCSLCQTHWAGLLYLIITGQWSFAAYALVLVLAFLTPVTGSLLTMARDFMLKAVDAIYTFFNL